MIEAGWDLAIGHGNGPQVGFILRRSEIAAKVEGMHEVPLDVCGADSQGAIGYEFQQALQNEYQRRGINKDAVTLVTQTLVDKQDPAFQKPTKPIGSFMDEAEAKRRESTMGWSVVEDAGRGWRRVVASPLPKKILELESVEDAAPRRASPSSPSAAAESQSSTRATASMKAQPRSSTRTSPPPCWPRRSAPSCS